MAALPGGGQEVVSPARRRDGERIARRATVGFKAKGICGVFYCHVGFGTRFRRPLITPEVRPRLWDYMGGIARENRCPALTIGGMSDHAHVLISLNPAIALADAVKEIKAGSSAWTSTSRTTGKDFQWQEGYAGFTVSLSNLDSVKHYIDHQEEHHRKMDFATEWKLLLEKHGIDLKAG